MAPEHPPPAPAGPRHQRQPQLPLRRRGGGPGDPDRDAPALVALDALRDLLQAVVVGPVGVAEVPHQVPRLQARRVRGAPRRHGVDPREGVVQPLGGVVSQGGLLAAAAGGLGGRHLVVGGVLHQAGEVLVEVLLDLAHQVLVVVAQVYDSCSRGPDCGLQKNKVIVSFPEPHVRLEER